VGALREGDPVGSSIHLTPRLSFLISFKMLTRGELPNQIIDPSDGMFDMSEYLSGNAHGFLPVPTIITDPTLDRGLGMAGFF